MKKILLIALMCLTGSVFAQEMSKQEAKEWKKKLKSMSVEDFKALVEEHEANQVKVHQLEQEVEEAQASQEELQAQVDKAKKEAAAAKQEAAAAKEEAAKGPAVEKGLVFKVQIGAFNDLDLREYFENNQNFSGEVDADGTMKYTIGTFKDYWEADKFKKYLRKMGVKGAWIVAYKDGQRVDIKEALEGNI